MTDHQTTLLEMRQLVADFVDQRGWQAYHTPKNLAMSLAIEVAELMEHFQWQTAEESQAVADSPEALEQIADELADCFAYTLAIANRLEIDLSDALTEKMKKNRAKYPVEPFEDRSVEPT